ncbi:MULTISPECIES: hypothetical protein [unclassified Leptolyngbya]|uniref:hypothetical protein n=1 Tax=unclassified Leptolyngbya TaxID=2650499 RepID=UPI0016854DE1|nr:MULTISPECIES: hypothetical protein [unclassified Leptolyngbya]MBD1913709.1 hypothetical protein [Leptolyngbya sp. FACHB-8]MBD2155175.1 hypothetical protein [Leptolyngbya sp. FACHB-16]
MVYSIVRQSQWAIAVFCTLLAVGCSDNRAAQCNRLTEVTNKTVGEVQTIVSAGNQPNAEALERVAGSFDRGRQEMAAISLSDEELESFQQRFVDLYGDVSTSARTLAEALNAQDFTAAQKARSEFQSATEREAPLVQDVNAYCGETATP